MNASTQFYAFGFGTDSNNLVGDIPIIGALNLDVLLSTSSEKALPKSSGINFGDKMLYIYTSGTTGLPKAVFFIN